MPDEPDKPDTPSDAVVNLWKRSEELAKIKANDASGIKPQVGSTPISSERSAMWNSLSQMSPADQAKTMSRLAGDWPYAKERRALNWPIHAGLLANCVSASLICSKINADMLLFNARLSYLESIKQAPKSPLVMGIYTSGVTFFLLQQVYFTPVVFGEDDPCASCTLSTAAAISMATGIAVPMLATPYLAYYVMLQRKQDKYPQVKNMIEMLTLCWEGSRAARPLVPALVVMQLAVATAATYASLWGRKRMFGTLEVDPELARELIIKAQTKDGPKEKVMEWISNIPLLGGMVKETPPEQERVKVPRREQKQIDSPDSPKVEAEEADKSDD
ncbi:hypothetical protein PMAYCL1PPCAC_00034 [Pristionchus mayeri]|uniref:Transmembrane protein n=1 Tax=Pristionchus mayeri TaxID=1317129 RepID=A0AAN5C5L9_9BILA|nr:hypothetical protein PMAYCL1PPCAC_00034 [Pristionchus mayeri]